MKRIFLAALLIETCFPRGIPFYNFLFFIMCVTLPKTYTISSKLAIQHQHNQRGPICCYTLTIYKKNKDYLYQPMVYNSFYRINYRFCESPTWSSYRSVQKSQFSFLWFCITLNLYCFNQSSAFQSKLVRNVSTRFMTKSSSLFHFTHYHWL